MHVCGLHEARAVVSRNFFVSFPFLFAFFFRFILRVESLVLAALMENSCVASPSRCSFFFAFLSHVVFVFVPLGVPLSYLAELLERAREEDR